MLWFKPIVKFSSFTFEHWSQQISLTYLFPLRASSKEHILTHRAAHQRQTSVCLWPFETTRWVFEGCPLVWWKLELFGYRNVVRLLGEGRGLKPWKQLPQVNVVGLNSLVLLLLPAKLVQVYGVMRKQHYFDILEDNVEEVCCNSGFTLSLGTWECGTKWK